MIAYTNLGRVARRSVLLSPVSGMILSCPYKGAQRKPNITRLKEGLLRLHGDVPYP